MNLLQKFGPSVLSTTCGWLTACHIPGKSNVIADRESRQFSKHDAEWMLNKDVLNKALCRLKFYPDIDLFASRLNHQFAKYCSLRPDPNAMIIDAFTFSWKGENLLLSSL